MQLADDAAGLGHKLFDVAEIIAPQSAPGISRSDVEVGRTKEGDGGRRKQREWLVHQLQQATGRRRSSSRAGRNFTDHVQIYGSVGDRGPQR